MMFRKTLCMFLVLFFAISTKAIAAEGPEVVIGSGSGYNYIHIPSHDLDGHRLVPRMITSIGGHAPVSSFLEYASRYGEVVAAFNGRFFIMRAGGYDRVDTFTSTSFVAPSDRYIFRGYRFGFTTYGEWVLSGDYGPSGLMEDDSLLFTTSNYPTLVLNGERYETENWRYEVIAGVRQRTLFGVHEDGSLTVVEGGMDFDRARDVLLDLGVRDGINMDGGASSFLYANGRTIRNPGRDLPWIFAVYRIPVPSPIPTQVEVIFQDRQFTVPGVLIDGNLVHTRESLAPLLSYMHEYLCFWNRPMVFERNHIDTNIHPTRVLYFHPSRRVNNVLHYSLNSVVRGFQSIEGTDLSLGSCPDTGASVINVSRRSYFVDRRR